MDRGAWGATVHGVAKELDTTEPLNNGNKELNRNEKKKQNTLSLGLVCCPLGASSGSSQAGLSLPGGVDRRRTGPLAPRAGSGKTVQSPARRTADPRARGPLCRFCSSAGRPSHPKQLLPECRRARAARGLEWVSVLSLRSPSCARTASAGKPDSFTLAGGGLWSPFSVFQLWILWLRSVHVVLIALPPCSQEKTVFLRLTIFLLSLLPSISSWWLSISHLLGSLCQKSPLSPRPP